MFRKVFVFFLLVLAAPLSAEMQGENLLVSIPGDYILGNSGKNGDVLLSEFVRRGESVENWSELLTVTVNLGHFDGKHMAPSAYETMMKGMWEKSCPDSSFRELGTSEQNGYKASLFMLSCKTADARGRPEYTLFKALAGNDSFYTVQKAFHFKPTRQQINSWLDFLKDVRICDSRRPEAPCP